MMRNQELHSCDNEASQFDRTFVTIFGVCVVESQLEVLLMTKKFISRRNFCVKQAPSAEVIYNHAVHTQRRTANSK